MRNTCKYRFLPHHRRRGGIARSAATPRTGEETVPTGRHESSQGWTLSAVKGNPWESYAVGIIFAPRHDLCSAANTRPTGAGRSVAPGDTGAQRGRTWGKREKAPLRPRRGRMKSLVSLPIALVMAFSPSLSRDSLHSMGRGL